MFEQVLKVRSNEVDGDESGRHWTVNYILSQMVDDTDGLTYFGLYTDDGYGNGVEICRGTNKNRMVSLALKLGELIEWKSGQDVSIIHRAFK